MEEEREKEGGRQARRKEESKGGKRGRKGGSRLQIQILFVSGIYKGRFPFQSSKEMVCFVFILCSIFHLGKLPSFEASLFKLIRKTINDGSFHEIVVGGISVMGVLDQSSNILSMEMGGPHWLLVQLES